MHYAFHACCLATIRIWQYVQRVQPNFVTPKHPIGCCSEPILTIGKCLSTVHPNTAQRAPVLGGNKKWMQPSAAKSFWYSATDHKLPKLYPLKITRSQHLTAMTFSGQGNKSINYLTKFSICQNNTASSHRNLLTFSSLIGLANIPYHCHTVKLDQSQRSLDKAFMHSRYLPDNQV